MKEEAGKLAMNGEECWGRVEWSLVELGEMGICAAEEERWGQWERGKQALAGHIRGVLIGHTGDPVVPRGRPSCPEWKLPVNPGLIRNGW